MGIAVRERRVGNFLNNGDEVSEGANGRERRQVVLT